MSDKIAKIISFILHPLLMPTLGMVFILNSGNYMSYLPFEAKTFLISIVILGTLILPLSMVPVFSYFRVISNIEIDKASERTFPLLITSILYFMTYYFTRRFPLPIINAFLLAASLAVFINFLINLRWKISSHMIGLGGLTALMSALSFRLHVDITLFLIIGILISGLAGFARLQLQKHSSFQVYGGYFLGYLVSLAVFFL